MNESRYLYTIARYVADPVRNEPRNIGVIMQCTGFNFVGSKFASNLRGKLSSTASATDLSLLKSYAEEFESTFKPFSDPTTQISAVAAPVLAPDYLKTLSQKRFGRLQFTLPRSGVTSDPIRELDYLYETFVEAIVLAQKEVMKQSQLKTELKKEFRKLDILATAKDLKSRKQSHKFHVDFEVEGARSKQVHRVDFGAQNGRLIVIEAVDMRRSHKEVELKTFESAIKIEDLRHGLGESNLHGYSVVTLPETAEGSLDYYLALLDTYSTKLFVLNDKKQHQAFQREVLEMLGVPPTLV